ncbi:hypothetical protein PENANT_c001G06744 [Penicillium antarcticum]|uniref:Uncharacterized protein n=1 Tax=Penicillium antarcticum TaxID=416450 RepID=A0A1V6QMP3_9EURO|nr:hypothetical protein PENANT_c001G06744 [Penicillium antarcticum]
MSLNSQNKGTGIFRRKDPSIAPGNGFDRNKKRNNESNLPAPGGFHDAPVIIPSYNKKRNNWPGSSAAPGASSPAPGNRMSTTVLGGFGAPGIDPDYNKKRSTWLGNRNGNTGYDEKRNNGPNNGVQSGNIVSDLPNPILLVPKTDTEKMDARYGNQGHKCYLVTTSAYVPNMQIPGANIIQHDNHPLRGNNNCQVSISAYGPSMQITGANVVQRNNGPHRGNRTQNQQWNNQRANQSRQRGATQDQDVDMDCAVNNNQSRNSNKSRHSNQGRNYNQGPRNYSQAPRNFLQVNNYHHLNQNYNRGNYQRGNRQNYNNAVSSNPRRNKNDEAMFDSRDASKDDSSGDSSGDESMPDAPEPGSRGKQKHIANKPNQPKKFERAFRDIGLDIDMPDAPSDEPVSMKPQANIFFGQPSLQFPDYLKSDIEMVDAPPFIIYDPVSEIQNMSILDPWHQSLSTITNQPRAQQRTKAFTQGAHALQKIAHKLTILAGQLDPFVFRDVNCAA